MIWLFDLDNTLYPYSSGIYQHINFLMNQYLQKVLNVNLQVVNKIRETYVQIYGTTLQGMMIHHNTDPDEFLKEIHSFSIDQFLKKETKLFQFLKNVSGKKYIFTNSPSFYAKNVLSCLGIQELFESIFSIESVSYHGKPNSNAFAKVVETLKTNEIIHFVDDEPANIKMAEKFNFKTYLVNSKKKEIVNYYEDELFSKLRGVK